MGYDILTDTYRIMDIQQVNLNNRKMKIFRFYRREGDIFRFKGTFKAPHNVADENLIDYVPDDLDEV